MTKRTLPLGMFSAATSFHKFGDNYPSRAAVLCLFQRVFSAPPGVRLLFGRDGRARRTFMKANATFAIPKVFAMYIWHIFGPSHQFLRPFRTEHPTLPNSGFFFGHGEEGERRGEEWWCLSIYAHEMHPIMGATSLRPCTCVQSTKKLPLC